MLQKFPPLKGLRNAGFGLALGLGLSLPASAMCTMFIEPPQPHVTSHKTELTNETAQVVMVRDGTKTVVTMAADYKGDASEFVMIVPVPERITREQVNVANPELLAKLQKFTSPRITKIHDPDPCMRGRGFAMAESADASAPKAMSGVISTARERRLGVRVLERFDVGEYDIEILSASQSNGLIRYLEGKDYKLPSGAKPVLRSYIKQNMKFLLAKVDIEAHRKSGTHNLRPLQIAYDHKKFMLPIRLGMVNAKGDQDLVVYAITRGGRVETSNYRTSRLPAGMTLPAFIEDDFDGFYNAMFNRLQSRENGKAVILEYAARLNHTSDGANLRLHDLRRLGLMWDRMSAPDVMPEGFLTKLHVRYNSRTFPDDLQLIMTGDETVFEPTYSVNQVFKGHSHCGETVRQQYWRDVKTRDQGEAQRLARLTGWSMSDIATKTSIHRKGADMTPLPDEPDGPWWRDMWNKDEG